MPASVSRGYRAGGAVMSADIISMHRPRAKKRSKKQAEPQWAASIPLAPAVELIVRRIEPIPEWLETGKPAEAKRAAKVLTASIDDLKAVLARNSENAGKSLAHLLALAALGEGITLTHIDGARRGIRVVLALLEEINRPLPPRDGNSAA